MQARRKDKFEALQITEALKNEQGQATIRAIIPGVTQVELWDSRIDVSTRYTKYDLNIGDWILKDVIGGVSRIKELDFKMNYEEAEN